MDTKVKEKDLTLYIGDDKIVSSNELYKILTEKHPGTIPYIKTSFPTLNDLIGGFIIGELNTISGITGNGKTLFMQTLTKNFADKNINSLWFTYEVPSLQFLRQFGENIPHFYMPKILKEQTMKWIYNRILEAKQKYNVSVIFIDHLHYLADIMISSQPSLEIGRVMRILQRWAIELELIIFLAAHTKKVKPETELDLGDTRDSSFTEQESSNVFYIWRLTNTDSEAILKIVKNRGRGVMNKKINLIKIGRYLTELRDIKEEIEEFQEKQLDKIKSQDELFYN